MDGDGNAGCDPLEELLPNQQHTVIISISAAGVDVTVNNELVCSRIADARRPWPHVHVFASDPWHEPALATLNTLIVRPGSSKTVRTQIRLIVCPCFCRLRCYGTAR